MKAKLIKMGQKYCEAKKTWEDEYDNLDLENPFEDIEALTKVHQLLEKVNSLGKEYAEEFKKWVNRRYK